MTQLDWLFLYKKLQTRKFKGNLDLEKLKIPSWFRIPDNLEIEGYLDLSQTNISKLPKNLQCEGCLYLFKCKNIKELPEDLKVKTTISVRGSSIERLPKNLQCEYLVLTDCRNIKQLSEGLKVEYLYIKGSGLIKEYCERMKQDRIIFYKTLYAY